MYRLTHIGVTVLMSMTQDRTSFMFTFVFLIEQSDLKTEKNVR